MWSALKMTWKGLWVCAQARTVLRESDDETCPVTLRSGTRQVYTVLQPSSLYYKTVLIEKIEGYNMGECLRHSPILDKHGRKENDIKPELEKYTKQTKHGKNIGYWPRVWKDE